MTLTVGREPTVTSFKMFKFMSTVNLKQAILLPRHSPTLDMQMIQCSLQY